jgi:hypothetical protein
MTWALERRQMAAVLLALLLLLLVGPCRAGGAAPGVLAAPAVRLVAVE